MVRKRFSSVELEGSNRQSPPTETRPNANGGQSRVSFASEDGDNRHLNYKDYLRGQRMLKMRHMRGQAESRNLGFALQENDDRGQRSSTGYNAHDVQRRALSIVGRRHSSMQASSEWQSFINLEAQREVTKSKDDDEHDEHDHDINVPWYSVPVQRQRWGDDQVLPHINWGDLFFDLFYVAAAYNLGSLLISAMNKADWSRGVGKFTLHMMPLSILRFFAH